MRRRCSLILGVLLSYSLQAQSVEEERASLRQTELDFARSVQEKNEEKFRSFISEDAVFLSNRTLRGRDAIWEVWSVFFRSDGPLLEWRPLQVEVLESRGVGITSGPYTWRRRDSQGNELTETGTFFSVWERQTDGSWKIIADAGSKPCSSTDP